MENLKPRVLVTGGGAPGAPGILQALKSKNKYTLLSCDYLDNVIGKFIADIFFTVPMGNDPNYSQILLEKCLQHEVDTILPITTKEIEALAENKKLFSARGIKIIVSEPDTITIANNKAKLLDYLKTNNVAVPHFIVCTNFSEFEKAILQLGFPENDVVFKPSKSNGSRGVRVVTSKIDRYSIVFNQKPGDLRITYEEARDILKDSEFPELVVSEYLPGDEYSIDCFVHQSKPIYIIPRRRTAMRAGISIKGVIEQNDYVINYCKEILTKFNFEGPIGIQVKLDTKNQPLILEINPRLQGTSVACLGAGINLPELAINPPEHSALNMDVKWGIQFIRYYSELFY